MDFVQYLTFENLGMVAAIVISVASALAKAIDLFTDVHPDDDLNAFASKLRRYTAKARRILGKLGLNSKEDRQ